MGYLLQEPENRTVEVGRSGRIHGRNSGVDRETVKDVAQGAENYPDPWFDGMKGLGVLLSGDGSEDMGMLFRNIIYTDFKSGGVSGKASLIHKN